jgi:hypothetical protein
MLYVMGMENVQKPVYVAHFVLFLFIQAPSVSVSPEVRCIMLRYLSHLVVWQLGNTAPIHNEDEVHEGILSLTEDPVQLLTIKSRGGDAIVCADISNDGKWIAYSSLATTRFFKFQAVSFGYFVMFRCVQNIGLSFCK